MPYGGPPEDDLGPTQGIAGGPQPTPSGFDDGTPWPGEAKIGLPPDQAQRDAARTAERSGGGPDPGSGGGGEGQRGEGREGRSDREGAGGDRGREEHPEHVYDDPAEGKDPPPEHGA